MYIPQASCSTLKTPVRVAEANNSYGYELRVHPQSTLSAVMFHSSTDRHMRVFCSCNSPPAIEEVG